MRRAVPRRSHWVVGILRGSRLRSWRSGFRRCFGASVRGSILARSGVMQSDSARAGRRRWVVTLGTAFLVAAVAGLLWWAWSRSGVQDWMAEAPPLPFFAAMAVLPALGAPITPFFVLAGAAFGSRLGLAGSAAALAANLTLCHSLARGKLRPRIASLLARFGYTLPDFEVRREGRFRFTLLVKLAPGLPAFAKNYLLGVAGVPFALYFVVSMAITGAYGAALAVLGTAALHHDVGHGVTAAAVLVLAATGAWLWRRRAGSRAAEAIGSGTQAAQTPR